MQSGFRFILIDLFQKLVIPLLLSLTLTIIKSVADQEPLSLDRSNDIALDMVAVAVGALTALFGTQAPVPRVVDAGIGDAFLAAILLYFRASRKRPPKVAPPAFPFVAAKVGFWEGSSYLVTGLAALIWTVYPV